MTDDLVKRARKGGIPHGRKSRAALCRDLDIANARIELLEADLARSVYRMQRVKDFRYDPNIGVELNMLEATLAELTGENQDGMV